MRFHDAIASLRLGSIKFFSCKLNKTLALLKKYFKPESIDL
jgi:hypothetical protein